MQFAERLNELETTLRATRESDPAAYRRAQREMRAEVERLQGEGWTAFRNGNLWIVHKLEEPHGD